jgi:hypothetical protein
MKSIRTGEPDRVVAIGRPSDTRVDARGGGDGRVSWSIECVVEGSCLSSSSWGLFSAIKDVHQFHSLIYNSPYTIQPPPYTVYLSISHWRRNIVGS